ncbi:MAG: hypothetical protein KAG06_07380 [Methylococcales bacterium]|nr:hypothetical protein [Methylococcales bacterium]
MFLAINKQKMLIFLMFSVISAVILSIGLPTKQIEEQFVNFAVNENLSYLADSIKDEPLETKAILLDYADNKELAFKAWFALKKYPDKAQNIFFLYGQEAEFQQALLKFGTVVIPVTDYFLKNDISLWNAQKSASTAWNQLKNWATGDNQSSSQKTAISLSSEQRGWYAINYINTEGHNFLRQFILDPQGNAKWIQTVRFMEAFSEFFAGGIRTLEEKTKTDQKITGGDLFWASFDVIAITSSLKLLRSTKALSASKALRSGKRVSFMTKTRVFASKFFRSKTAQKIVKFGAIATTVYVAVSHPSLINNLFEDGASFLGVSPLMVKLVAWTSLIFFLLYPFTWLFNYLIKPVIWLMQIFIVWVMHFEAFISGNTASSKLEKKRLEKHV